VWHWDWSRSQGVAVPTHCEVGGEFVKVAAEGQVVEEEVSM